MEGLPFSDEELAVLRGMIDEYRFAQRRRLLWSQRWHVVSSPLLFTLRVVLYSLQIALAAVAVYALAHH